MINQFTNALKAQAAALTQSTGQIKFGIVASVNTQNATARVQIQPENVLSGWLPVLTQWLGSGWGLACPPAPGDQVLVAPQEGDVEHGVIIGGIFSKKQMPPAAPAGEFWLVHQKGNALKLCNDGTVQIIGDLHVQGDVFDSVGSLSRLRNNYNQHTHTAPGGKTSQPVPLDQSS